MITQTIIKKRNLNYKYMEESYVGKTINFTKATVIVLNQMKSNSYLAESLAGDKLFLKIWPEEIIQSKISQFI